MRCVIVIVLTAVFMLSSAPAFSHWGGRVRIEVISDRGNEFLTLPFKEFQTGGTHVIKRYLEAKKGENYSIVIRNNMSERIGVAIAVDGRNIITGKKSYLKNNEMMYIVEPYGYTKLEGWRTDDNTVHRFYFTDVQDSYAVRTFSDTSAMGVIAIAVFREKDRPKILHEEQIQKEKAPTAPQGSAKGELKRYENDAAGTGFGNETYSPVIKVEFEPEVFPFEKILVKYEWHEVLCKKGILKCWTEERNRLWDESEYAPYPPGYIYR
ncbi:MAG: hypothetical protein HY755_04940 [Nitrospirae bacterium]|nr:hypothetical protein [Nitrospirota bacterium]